MSAPTLRVAMARPDVDESDVAAVTAVLRSGTLSLGRETPAFETDLARYVGARHVVAMNSGTAALHVAVRALGLGPGDEVLVPSFTFAASVNALLYEGVTPVFVDVDPETFNLDPADLERKAGPRVRAVMAVDVFGHPVEWDPVLDFARARGLRVIDDSCEALGAAYRGRRLGTFGDVSAFAFYPNKQMTTGEGGVLVTEDDDVARVARSLRNQGRAEMGAWLEHERLGYNYRMDEMSAALGRSQLARLDALLARREEVAALYARRLRGLAWVRPPVVRPHVRMSWFVYVVTLEGGLDRDAVMAHMESEGVPARGYFAPIHTQPYLRGLPARGGDALPVTEDAARRTLALPFHGAMRPEEVDLVVECLEAAVKRAGSA